MVVVEIKLWPLGDAEKSRSLGSLRIANTGKGTKEEGIYDVTLFGPDGQVLKRERISGFRRLEQGGPELTLMALQAVLKPPGRFSLSALAQKLRQWRQAF